MRKLHFGFFPLLVLSLAFAVIRGDTASQPNSPLEPRLRWYKGNTHTHTLNSDGDSTPDDVVRWYREHGYQFLVLTDHNFLTAVDGLNALHGADEKFLVVRGEEWTAPNPHSILKEGDTPSWFHFLPTGLSDPDYPEWGGSGGRFERADGSLYRDAKDSLGETADARATVWRWRPAFQNKFRARMDWNVKPYGEANPPEGRRKRG